ncbi:MAG TPA: DUF3616 domain-containing protein [Blastocatellia bacterium]|nr:DUF3616 domain-containing protein [Blastocatellia bacterium]
MELKTKKPLLRFNAAHEEVEKSLSAAIFIDDYLWVASDESISLERLSTEDGLTFENHKSVPLDGLITLPAAGTDVDQEIDIEGLDFQDSHLWLVGSHSLKRKKVDETDEGDDTKLIKKLSKVESKGNRFILARVPLIRSGAEQDLRSPTESPPGSGKILKASQLACGPKSNALVDAIRQAEGGKGDAHLARFLDIPGKDNGFDIEGLAVAGSKVFLGLRGPVLRGWAVVLELSIDTSDPSSLTLTNFEAVDRPYRKHFLNLDGLGVRELCLDGEDLLIMAGPTMNLDGSARIYRWKGAVNSQEETLVRGDRLVRIFEIPMSLPGTDRPEGFAIIPGLSQPRQILVVYDSPSFKRTNEGTGTVTADVFELPEA